MRTFLVLVLMAACAGQPEEVQQGVGDQPIQGNSPECPANGAPVIRSVGTYWPKVVGWNNANPPTQVIFSSPGNGFTCDQTSNPRPWQYPVPADRRYAVCTACAGGWQPYQAFPVSSKTSTGTYALQTAQACVKMCAGGDWCDSYERQDAQYQCKAGPGAGASCRTWG